MQYYDNYVSQERRKRRSRFSRRRPTTTQSESSETVAAAHHIHDAMVAAESTKREYQKLAGVYAVIVLCATIMAFVLGFDLRIWLEWFMGGFMIIFGSFKLIGYEMFIMMFPQYDPFAAKSKVYTMIYPFIELFLGFLFVSNLLPVFRDLTTLVIFGVGAWGVLQYTSRQHNEKIQCACLGNIIKLPLSTVTLIEDVLMAVLSVIMLIGYIIF